LRGIDRIILTGCGTAFHAAMCGEYIIESLAHVPVECEFASEFRYRNLPLPKDTLVFLHQPERRNRGYACGPAGKPAQGPSHPRHLQQRGLDDCAGKRWWCLHARGTGNRCRGHEVIHLAGDDPDPDRVADRPHRHLSTSEGLRVIDELEALPDKVRQILKLDSHIKSIAQKYSAATAMMFLGRQYNFPVALEGALKMKEISYIHASGHPSAELKHGVIALITPELPSVFIARMTACSKRTSRTLKK
jgi:glucosamine--fructose-6-phosphate aminotransferase (isomerizing)